MRLELDPSQPDLAFRSDFDSTYISEIENAERNLSLITITKLSKGLEVEPVELLKYE